jgi:hypothetical protein
MPPYFFPVRLPPRPQLANLLRGESIALQEARCGSSTTCELDRPLERLCDRIDRVRSILAEDFERNYFQR